MLRASWGTVRQGGTSLWLAALVLCVVPALARFAALELGRAQLRAGADTFFESALAFVLVSGWTAAAHLAVFCSVRPGYLSGLGRRMAGKSAPPATVFSFDRFGPLLRAELLRIGLWIGAMVLAALPGAILVSLGLPRVGLTVAIGTMIMSAAYLWVSLVFVDWEVALGGRGAFDAIAASCQRTRDQRGTLLVVLLGLKAIEVAALAGIFAGGVGVLVTLPAARLYGDAVLTRIYLEGSAEERSEGRPPRPAPPLLGQTMGLTSVEYILVFALTAVVALLAWRSLGVTLADKVAEGEANFEGLPTAPSGSRGPGQEGAGTDRASNGSAPDEGPSLAPREVGGAPAALANGPDPSGDPGGEPVGLDDPAAALGDRLRDADSLVGGEGQDPLSSGEAEDSLGPSDGLPEEGGDAPNEDPERVAAAEPEEERGFWGRVGDVLSDAATGAVGGSFVECESWACTTGQAVGGIVPLADVRDVAASGGHVWNNPTSREAWIGLGIDGAGFVPLAGDGLKAAAIGLGAARRSNMLDDAPVPGTGAPRPNTPEPSSPGTAPRERLDEGSFSVAYREGDEVVKEIKPTVGRNEELRNLSKLDRENIADITAEFTNDLNDELGDVIPRMRAEGGTIRMPYVDGLSYDDLRNLDGAGEASARAGDNAREMTARATRALGLDFGGTGTLPSGYRVGVDDNMANFRFDRNGEVVGWFDPIMVFPDD